jgi:hypothetical protein
MCTIAATLAVILILLAMGCALYAGIGSLVLLGKAGLMDFRHLTSSTWLFQPGHFGAALEPERQRYARVFMLFFVFLLFAVPFGALAATTCADG